MVFFDHKTISRDNIHAAFKANGSCLHVDHVPCMDGVTRPFLAITCDKSPANGADPARQWQLPHLPEHPGRPRACRPGGAQLGHCPMRGRVHRVRHPTATHPPSISHAGDILQRSLQWWTQLCTGCHAAFVVWGVTKLGPAPKLGSLPRDRYGGASLPFRRAQMSTRQPLSRGSQRRQQLGRPPPCKARDQTRPRSRHHGAWAWLGVQRGGRL